MSEPAIAARVATICCSPSHSPHAILTCRIRPRVHGHLMPPATGTRPSSPQTERQSDRPLCGPPLNVTLEVGNQFLRGRKGENGAEDFAPFLCSEQAEKEVFYSFNVKFRGATPEGGASPATKGRGSRRMTAETVAPLRKLRAPSKADGDFERWVLNHVALNVERVMFRHALKVKGELLKIAEYGEAVVVVLRYNNIGFKPPTIVLVGTDVGKASVSTENAASFKNCDASASALKV